MKKGSCLPIVFSQVIYSGGYSDGEPPLPIPNREAKPVIANGTARPGGRVGSRRAWKESSDERSSGDSFSCLQVCAGISVVQAICPCACACGVTPVAEIRSGMPVSLLSGRSNFCTFPRHMSTQVSLRPVPVAGLCGPGVTCFPAACRPGPVDMCICPGCTRPMATCVMTVSVSTLLTGQCGRNCLYLN